MKKNLITCFFILLLFIPAAQGQETASEWFQKGKEYYGDKRYHAAVDAFTQALLRKPDSYAYYNWRGWAFYRLKDYERALQEFDEAISLKDDSVRNYYARGWTHWRLKNYDKAVADFTEGIKLKEEYKKGELFFMRARARSFLTADEQSVQDYTRAIELGFKKTYAAYNQRGSEYERLSNWRAALKDYAIAQDLEPKRSWAYYQEGRLLYRLKRYTPAERSLQKSLKNNPDFVAPHSYLGLIDLIMGRYSDAEKRFEKARTSDSERIIATHNLASVYLLTNRAEMCSKLLLELFDEIDPGSNNYVYTAILASFSLKEQGRDAEGNDLIRKAYRKISTAIPYYTLLGYLNGEITAKELLEKKNENDELFRTTVRAVMALEHLYEGKRQESLPYFRTAVHQGKNAPFSTVALLEYRNLVAENPDLTDAVPASVYFEPDPVRRGEVGRIVAEYIPFPGQTVVEETWTIHSPGLTSPPLKKRKRIGLDDHRQFIDFRIPEGIARGTYELRLKAAFAGKVRTKKGHFRVK